MVCSWGTGQMNEKHPAEAKKEMRKYVFISGRNTLFKIRLTTRARGGLTKGKKYISWRWDMVVSIQEIVPQSHRWIRDAALLKSKGTITHRHLHCHCCTTITSISLDREEAVTEKQGTVCVSVYNCVCTIRVCVCVCVCMQGYMTSFFLKSRLRSLLSWQGVYRNGRNKIIKRVLCSPLMAMTYATILKGCVIDSL